MKLYGQTKYNIKSKETKLDSAKLKITRAIASLGFGSHFDIDIRGKHLAGKAQNVQD